MVHTIISAKCTLEIDILLSLNTEPDFKTFAPDFETQIRAGHKNPNK